MYITIMYKSKAWQCSLKTKMQKKPLHLKVQLLQLKFSVSVNQIFIPRVFPQHYFSTTKSLEYISKVKYRTQYWDVSTSVIRRYNKYKHTKLFLMLLLVHIIAPHIFSSRVNSLQAQGWFWEDVRLSAHSTSGTLAQSSFLRGATVRATAIWAHTAAFFCRHPPPHPPSVLDT